MMMFFEMQNKLREGVLICQDKTDIKVLIY